MFNDHPSISNLSSQWDGYVNPSIKPSSQATTRQAAPEFRPEHQAGPASLRRSESCGDPSRACPRFFWEICQAYARCQKISLQAGGNFGELSWFSSLLELGFIVILSVPVVHGCQRGKNHGFTMFHKTMLLA